LLAIGTDGVGPDSRSHYRTGSTPNSKRPSV